VVEGNLLTPFVEVIVKGLNERKRLKTAALVLPWICLIFAGFHFPVPPAWGDRENQEFQGVVMEKDSLKRVIYVNEMEIRVPRDTEITTVRQVSLSFSSLRPKQWVFIRAHRDRKGLVADEIVLIPRYIPVGERKKYPFMARGGFQ
jgi:hypothetical protein